MKCSWGACRVSLRSTTTTTTGFVSWGEGGEGSRGQGRRRVSLLSLWCDWLVWHLPLRPELGSTTLLVGAVNPAGVCDSVYVTLECGFVGLINAWQPTREDELGSAERLLMDWRNRVCCMPPSAWVWHCSIRRYGLHSKSYSTHSIC